MRYRKTKKEVIDPKVGDKRLTYKFLWFPLTIDGETRWWEKVIIRQEYKEDGGYHYCDYDGWPTKSWVSVGFVDFIPNIWEITPETIDDPIARPE